MEKRKINRKKWSPIKFLFFLMLFMIFFSCQSNDFKLYYYNGLNSDNNYVIASSLRIFFEDDEEMAQILVNDKTVKKELSEIKNKIVLKNNVFDLEDGNYSFAFINEIDTLFAQKSLEFWKYKDKGLAVKLSYYSKKKILEYYKISPNQY